MAYDRSSTKKQSEIYKSKEEETKKSELDALNKRIEDGFNVLNNPVTVFCGTYKKGEYILIYNKPLNYIGLSRMINESKQSIGSLIKEAEDYLTKNFINK